MERSSSRFQGVAPCFTPCIPLLLLLVLQFAHPQRHTDPIPHAMPPAIAGRIMKLNTFCPWKEHLYVLEEEMGVAGEVLYCLYEVRTYRLPPDCGRQ